VTHDQVEATTMADRIGILEQGRLQQVGTPLEVYERPASLRVAQRLGSPAINALPARWFAGDAPGEATPVGLRPADGELAGAGTGGGVVEGRVLECSLPKHQLIADHDGVEIRARVLLEHAIAPGERVAFRFPRSRRLYFDRDGIRLDAR